MISLINLLVLLFFCFSLYRIYKKNRFFFYSSIIIFLSLFYGIISSIYIDLTSIFLFEIDAQSYPNGSAFINLIGTLTYIIIGVVSKESQLTSPPTTASNKMLNHFILVLFFCEFLLYLNYFISDKPYFSEITRMNYWGKSKLPFLRNIFGETSSFIFFGAGLIISFKKNKLAICLFLAHLVYNVLIGQKFGSIYEGFIYLFMTHLLIHRPKITSKFILYLFLFFTVAFATIYLSFSYFNPYGHLVEGDTITKAILYRAFALQSQLPWIAMNNLLNFNFNDFEISYFFDGMNTFIRQFTNTNMDDYDSTVMARLTNAYPANLFMWNNLFAFPVIILICFILYFAQFSFKRAFESSNLFYTLFHFQLFLSITNAVLMAETYKLLIFSFVLFFSHIVFKHFKWFRVG